MCFTNRMHFYLLNILWKGQQMSVKLNTFGLMVMSNKFYPTSKFLKILYWYELKLVQYLFVVWRRRDMMLRVFQHINNENFVISAFEFHNLIVLSLTLKRSLILFFFIMISSIHLILEDSLNWKSECFANSPRKCARNDPESDPYCKNIGSWEASLLTS